MKIAVVGTGYVGLVTGTCLAETGNEVICIDNNAQKIASLQKGIVPIYEPNLNALIERNTNDGRLKFSTDLEAGISNSDIVFLALPTPPGEDGQADLKYILNVAEEIGGILNKYTVIVDKSTVPVGTAEKVFQTIAQKAKCEFSVVSNPEFLREGFAISDFMKPDRIIIGVSDDRARKIMEHLYKPYVRQGNPIIFMDEKSAELTKYAANAFLATKISFMNEIANYCEKVGANVDHVRLGIGSDDRIGKRFLFPGIGYGGSCFPKDVMALHHCGKLEGYSFEIIDAVMRVNDLQRVALFSKLESVFSGNWAGKTFGIWGLAFKPDTDDIREAPALYLIDKLLEKGVEIKVYDPEAMENVGNIYGGKLNYSKNQYEATENVDALLICTEWSIFRTPDFEKLNNNMRQKFIFDGRNIFDTAEVKSAGFSYYSIGR